MNNPNFEEMANTCGHTLTLAVCRGCFTRLVEAAHLAGRVAGMRESAKECDRLAGNVADFRDRFVRKAAGTIGLSIRALATRLEQDGDK